MTRKPLEFDFSDEAIARFFRLQAKRGPKKDMYLCRNLVEELSLKSLGLPVGHPLMKFIKILNNHPRSFNILDDLNKYIYGTVILLTKGNQTKAALLLGVTRVTLRNNLLHYFGTEKTSRLSTKDLVDLIIGDKHEESSQSSTEEN